MRTAATAAIGCAGALALATAMSQGCSPGDCAEKAMCPDDDATGDDGPIPTDATTHDVGSDSMADAGDAGDTSRDATDTTDATDASDSPDDASACTDGFVCVEPVPLGWTGPLALFDQTGTPAPIPPPCPSAFPSVAFDDHGDPDAPAPSCGCSCGAPADAQCSPPQVRMFFGACPGSSACGTYDSSGACAGTLCAAAGSAIATSEPEGGACPPQPATSVPAWAWTRTARACEVASTPVACGAGVCAPAPPFPFASATCIAQSGDTACPMGSAYSQRYVFYAGATDGRGCTPCTCSAPSGIGCSTGAVTFYTQGTPPTCGGSSDAIPTDGLCHAITVSAAGIGTTTSPSPAGGSCTPDGGQPTGTVATTGAETVCCVP